MTFPQPSHKRSQQGRQPAEEQNGRLFYWTGFIQIPTTALLKVTDFNVDFRVHLAQVVHDTVQVELPCPQDDVFS